MVIGVIAWIIVVGLLALTVACQRPRWKFLKDLKYNDVAAFIPSWTFFAPNPGTTDTRVLWREQMVDGAISPWHELIPPSGGTLRMVWNPTKRERKLITDVGPMIIRMAMKNPTSEYTLISLPYLILLHGVSSLPASSLVTARQFIVVQTKHEGVTDDEMQPLFASRWHALKVNTSPRLAGEVSQALQSLAELKLTEAGQQSLPE